MSLKEFKQTLLSCSSRFPSSTVEISKSQDRRPPKSNLRDQIASIERLAEDLECTPSGEALPTLVSLPPLPSRRNRKVLGSDVSSQIARTDSQSRNEIGQQNVQAGLNDDFPEINYGNPPPKRTRLSDYADLVTGTELHLSTSSPKISQIMPTGLEESKGNSKAKICQDMETEDSGWDSHGQVTTIRERSHSHDLITFHAEDERPIDMEEDNPAINVGDSEAGLFIQSETDGLYEPLILWPPNGEGSSTGAGIVQVPASINSRLLEHQREGAKFLYRLFRENRGGVLGDDMGLGKTIQVIAFLAAILQSDHHDDGIMNQERLHKLASNRKPVLIICPTSVLRNWEQEFHAWGAFDVAIYHGIHRELVLSRLESGNLEILLTSFDTFRLHGDCLCVIDWHCVIADEAHRLKNEKSDLYKVCFKIPTKRRFGLTGTIMQNKIMDLFNLFDWVAPGCLGTREHFREFYDEPLKQGQRISAPEKFIQVAEQRRFHLAKVLQRYLLRREKRETIGHLMMGKEDNVVFCAMSTLQQTVYKRLLSSPDFQCLTRKDEKCSCGSPLTRKECCYRIVPNGFIWPYLHKERPDGCDSCPYCLVLPCLTKLQQVSNHLELIKSNSKDDIEKQKKDESLAEFVLGQDAGLVGGTTQDESFLGLSDSQHCGKMRALELLLAHWMPKGDKVLLFSYSVRMLDILNKFLIRKGYCFSRLDGSTPMSMRQTLVDDFNRSPSKKVFLISTRAGGLGLNLVSANKVVVFDPNWNPAQDLQAQDRSFRYGQRRHVTVFRLLAAGSLEELVYNRQIYKQQLFNIAVSGNLEKRYFEGVQDSKENKGELFGISNLFRDLSDKAFTSKIIDACSHGKGGRLAPEKGAEGGSDKSLVDGARLRLAPAGAVQEEKYTRDEMEKQKYSVKQSSLDGLAHVLQGAGVVYTHRNEDVVNYQARIKTDDDAVGRVVCRENQSVNSGGGLLQRQNSSRTVHATSKASTFKKENKVLEEIGSKKLKKIGGAKSMSIGNNIFSKEEQFDSLANFKGMDKPAFCKWLLSASDLERQKLLLDFKQGRKTMPA